MKTQAILRLSLSVLCNVIPKHSPFISSVKSKFCTSLVNATVSVRTDIFMNKWEQFLKAQSDQIGKS